MYLYRGEIKNWVLWRDTVLYSEHLKWQLGLQFHSAFEWEMHIELLVPSHRKRKRDSRDFGRDVFDLRLRNGSEGRQYLLNWTWTCSVAASSRPFGFYTTYLYERAFSHYLLSKRRGPITRINKNYLQFFYYFSFLSACIVTLPNSAATFRQIKLGTKLPISNIGSFLFTDLFIFFIFFFLFLFHASALNSFCLKQYIDF